MKCELIPASTCSYTKSADGVVIISVT